jgi:DNA polymerase eta
MLSMLRYIFYLQCKPANRHSFLVEKCSPEPPAAFHKKKSFLSQVEQVRLGIPRDVPVAVQQWEGLIAVNYAARAKGITRHMRVGEAKLKCPELVAVHVETIGGGEDTTMTTNTDNTNAGSGTDPTKDNTAVDRSTQKACLERYRRANSEILKILHKLAPTSVIEKASIDEVYIDVTAMVDAELQGKYNFQYNSNDGIDGDKDGDNICTGNNHASTSTPSAITIEASPSDAFSWGSIVPGGPLDPGSEFDVRLATGAGIACRLRGAILENLGYTSSAGIATNKLLAKIGSALHKPNIQTVIPPRAVQELMKDLPLKKVKNFGGKLGQQLEELFQCSTAGDVAAVPFESLTKLFGVEKARWIVDAVHGRNNDPVEEKEKPKSMLAAKSFTATSDTAALQRWIGILAAELAPRMANDEEMFRRRAKTLSVHFRGGSAPGQDRTRQGAMPRFSGGGVPCAETISHAAWEIFKTRCAGEALPCLRLALAAGDFGELPVQGKSAITNFLVAKNAPSSVGNVVADGGGSDLNNKRPLETNDVGFNAGDEKDSEQRDAKLTKPNEESLKDKGLEEMKSQTAVPVVAGKEEKQEEAIILPEELSGQVNIAEQRRLLKEATMLRALAAGNGKNKISIVGSGHSGSGGGRSGSNKAGQGSKETKGGQGNISSFFIRKS